jgi:hypothetical protein
MGSKKMMGSIKRYSTFNLQSFVEKQYSPRQPCLFQSGHRLEDLSRLPKILSLSELLLRAGDFANPMEYSFDRKLLKEPLSKYVKSLLKNKAEGYAGNIPVSWPDFLKIAGPPPFGTEKFFSEPRIWLGPQGSVTPLHIDAADNLAFHCHGLKKWLLFSPESFQKLEMFVPWPKSLPDFYVSQLDLRSPKVLKKLSERGIQPLEIILKPDDVLYVPRGWAHFVESLEISLLANLWFVVDPVTGDFQDRG